MAIYSHVFYREPSWSSPMHTLYIILRYLASSGNGAHLQTGSCRHPGHVGQIHSHPAHFLHTRLFLFKVDIGPSSSCRKTDKTYPLGRVSRSIIYFRLNFFKYDICSIYGTLIWLGPGRNNRALRSVVIKVMYGIYLKVKMKAEHTVLNNTTSVPDP